MQVTKFQKKIILFLTLIIILLLWLIEVNNIMIDKYNFQQLEKAKIILDKTPRDAKKFYNLEEFNEQYKAWIVPIKNCYYVRNINWSYPYIFWFKLESLFYKIKFSQNYYSYPKYDLPISKIYLWALLNWRISQWYDKNRDNFIHTISNPCKK